MIRETIFLGVVAASMAIDACPPSPQPPAPDASDAAPPRPGTSCNVACAQLAVLSCQEGLDPNCATVCQHAIDQRITALPLDCWTAARTKEAARACGSLACP